MSGIKTKQKTHLPGPRIPPLLHHRLRRQILHLHARRRRAPAPSCLGGGCDADDRVHGVGAARVVDVVEDRHAHGDAVFVDA
jgi:hypothetical protein